MAIPPKNTQFPAGFTLMELIVYAGILGVASLFVVGIFSGITRTFTQNQSKIEVIQNLRSATQIIQEAIQQASSINTTTVGVLNLEMAESSKNPTIFTLSNNTIYKQEGGGPQVAITSQKVRVTVLNFSIASTAHAPIDTINKWAWSGGASSATTAEGIGWIDFNPPGGNVRAPAAAGDFYGYAYALGPQSYIALNCATADYCTYPYKVSADANGNLAGWAWSDLFGWISFWCGNDHDPGTSGTQPYCAANGGYDYRVTISTSTGEFSGWAWSANEPQGGIGWISFNCNNSGIGNTCGTSNYKVVTQRKLGRPTNAVQVDIAMEYNTANPLAQFSDAYSFAVVLSQPSSVTVTAITPATSTRQVFTPTSITGTNFKSGATARLMRSGYNEINSSGTWTVSGGVSMSGGSFDLTDAALGYWDVMVINPDGQIGLLPSGLQVL